MPIMYNNRKHFRYQRDTILQLAEVLLETEHQDKDVRFCGWRNADGTYSMTIIAADVMMVEHIPGLEKLNPLEENNES